MKKFFLILTLLTFSACDQEEAKKAGQIVGEGAEEVKKNIEPAKNYLKKLWENFSQGYKESKEK